MRRLKHQTPRIRVLLPQLRQHYLAFTHASDYCHANSRIRGERANLGNDTAILQVFFNRRLRALRIALTAVAAHHDPVVGHHRGAGQGEHQANKTFHRYGEDISHPDLCVRPLDAPVVGHGT